VSPTEQKTVYDIIYSTDNPPEFYGSTHLIKTGACPHLAKWKQKLKEDGINGEENILENYRSLVQYSILWHKSRKSKIEGGKKRKQLKEVYISIVLLHPDLGLTIKKKLPLPQCSTCLDPLSRLHACLHCIYIGCWKKGHIKDHLKEKKHTFGKNVSLFLI
jgi:ubiquitin carboxyl-terminal hydrolase 22/27/51